MSIHYLPRELLFNVFQFLSKKDCFESLKVCKQWHTMLSPLCYRTVEREQITADDLLLIKQIRHDGHRIGDFIQNLTIKHGNSEEPPTDLVFHDLIHLLPRLKSIELHGFKSRYLQYFKTLPNQLKTRLHRLSVLWYGDQPDYLSALMPFKDSLTALDLIESPLYTSPYVSLDDLLSHFPHVNSITLWKANYLYDRGREALEAVLKNPRLHHLERQRTFEGTEFDPHPIAHPTLSSIKLHLESLTEPLLRYILDHLPNLTQLELTVDYCFSDQICRLELARLSTLTIHHRFSFYQSQDFLPRSFVWDMVRSGCQEGFRCDLDLELERYRGREGKVVVDRVRKTVRLELSWSVKDKVYWDQLDGLRYRTLVVRNRLLGDREGLLDLLSRLVVPGQVGLDQVCLIRSPQLIDIRPGPLSHWTYTDHQTFDLGQRPLIYLREIQLEDGLVKTLAGLYPGLEKVVLERCGLPMVGDGYRLDLRPLRQVRDFRFDFENLFSVRLPPLVWIEMVSDKERVGYLYDVLDPLFIRKAEGSWEMCRVEIRHAEIQHVVFVKDGVPLTLKS